jgi:hypothetical protein
MVLTTGFNGTQPNVMVSQQDVVVEHDLMVLTTGCSGTTGYNGTHKRM